MRAQQQESRPRVAASLFTRVDATADGERDPAEEFLVPNEAVPDNLGLGRHPNLWWTLNCAYSHVHDIHRFNVGEDADAPSTGEVEGD